MRILQKSFFLAAAVALGVGCTDDGVTREPTVSALAQVRMATNGKGVPNRWIVVLKEDSRGAASSLRETVSLYGGELDTLTSSRAGGRTVLLVQGTRSAIEALRRSEAVAYVEQDQETVPATLPWHLDRLDQRARAPRDFAFSPPGDGSGVRIYVLGVGLNASHNDFGGRASNVVWRSGAGVVGSPCLSHETHVAGAAGGATTGAASGAQILGIRVSAACSRNPYVSEFISGLDWIRVNAVRPATAVLSYSAGFSGAFNDAVTSLHLANVPVFVSAGNDGTTAGSFSPQSASASIVVGATNDVDGRASFSNYGSAVDLYAPGVGILVPVHNSNVSFVPVSGTSYAAPLAAGAAAIYLQSHPSASSVEVTSFLTQNATAGIVTGMFVEGPQNRLLFAGATFLVRILGPELIYGGGTATHTASVSYGVSPYTFEWRVDGLVQGSGSSFTWDYGPPGFGSQLALTVTDGMGRVGTATIWPMSVCFDGSFSC